jgi:nucleoside-diphosphate-sugar epimerase
MDRKVRVLIFGDRGRVGFALRKRLAEVEGFEIVNNEYDKSGADKDWEQLMIERCEGETALIHPDEIDISRLDLKEFIEHHRPDIIVDCAAIIGKEKCENFPAHAFSVNAVGVYNIARAIVDTKIKLVYMSTGERDNVYGISKAAGEAILGSYLPSDRTVIIRKDTNIGIGLERIVSLVVDVLKSKEKGNWGSVYA